MSDRRENDFRESKVRALGQDFAAALLAGDEVAAERVIRAAIDAGLETAQIDEEIIAPALWFVGELWERDEITVAEEHAATEICIRLLALQREAQRVVRSRGDRRVLLAAPAGELHVVALRMVANLLRDAGYGVVMLGADVPEEALVSWAAKHQPDVICLSVTMAGGADRVLVSIHELQQSWPGAGFVLGGRGVTSRLGPRPGISVCERVSDAVAAVDAMVRRADLN